MFGVEETFHLWLDLAIFGAKVSKQISLQSHTVNTNK